MIRLLIVDDSALIRRLLTELFEAEGDFQVAVARDGAEALAQLTAFAPDVVTLDVQMPGLNGLACLDRIMVERPTPVVMVSAVTTEGAEETLAALELGAVDVAPKPSGALSLRMDEFGPQLVEIVRGAAAARLPRARRLAERVRAAHAGRNVQTKPPIGRPAVRGRAAGKSAVAQPKASGLVLVGASTGGPTALDAMLAALPADFPWPILVAQHMPATFTAALARRLNGLTQLDVVEVSAPTALAAGRVYIGRGDADLVVSERPAGLVALATPSDERYRWHPSVDRLTESALAHVPPERLIGVLMTGMGNDGAAAMSRLHALGGRTIAEAESTAVVWGMPGELVRAGGASVVAPLDRIGAALAGMLAA